MDSHISSGTRTALAVAAAAALLTACAHSPPPKQFTAAAPYSKTFNGSGDTVCWSVKRALLSQGYMLDHANEGGVLTGSRDEQPKPKLNITTHLQTSCADNKNGTSIVFVTAEREENVLQKMKQTTSMGVGPATLTMPAGSARVLGTVRRETVRDPVFYGQFFDLVQTYANQERVSQAETHSVGGADRSGDRPAHLNSEMPQSSAGSQSSTRSPTSAQSQSEDSPEPRQ